MTTVIITMEIIDIIMDKIRNNKNQLPNKSSNDAFRVKPPVKLVKKNSITLLFRGAVVVVFTDEPCIQYVVMEKLGVRMTYGGGLFKKQQFTLD